MSYAESKKVLDGIRNDYACKGEIILRTSLQYVVEMGQKRFDDNEWVEEWLNCIDKKHDQAEVENKILYLGRGIEKAFVECARELSKVDPFDLLVYVQKEVWLSHEGGIDYDRAVKLLKCCMYDIEQRENCEDKLTLYAFEDIGFDDEELRDLGFGYLVKELEDEDYEI